MDRVSELLWLTLEVNRDRKKQPKPFPMPTPVLDVSKSAPHRSARPAQRHATIDEMKRFFGVPKGLPRGKKGAPDD